MLNIDRKFLAIRNQQLRIQPTLIAMAISMAVLPVGVHAQTDETAQRARPALEEIVVTAQKRSESLQDVPIAVTALSATALEQSGFDGVEDLSFLVPSLQLGNFGPTTFLNIRGIGSENTTGGSDPGVALHSDGVYVGRPVGALFSAFDIERVEVLRGPQGTLYGRNATGGSINLISAKPTDEFGGKVDVTAGNFNNFRIRGALNVPLSDTVRARIVAFKEDRDGFTKNTFEGGTDANDADNLGFRAHLDFVLSDTASLLLSATHIESEGVGTQPEQRDPFSVGPLGGPPPIRSSIVDNNGVPIINDLTPFREAKDTRESQDNTFDLLSATLSFELPGFDVKAITGVIDSEYTSVQDNDQSISFASQGELLVEEQSEQFSQEIQFLSKDGALFQWIAGLYYFKEDVDRFTTFSGNRFAFLESILGTTPEGISESFRIGGNIETTSYAAFAQTTFDLSDTLSLTTGLRYTDDEKSGVNRNRLFSPVVINDAVGTDSQEVTGKATIDWAFADGSLLYASYARGYKSGGINQTTVSTTGANAEFQPEFVNTYELGLKSRLFEDRVELNAALYSNDYTDLQFQIFGAFGPEAGNAGEATINGFELEWKALLSEVYSIDGSFAYTDAEYDELTFVDPGNVAAGPQSFAGNSLPRTPDITYNVGLTADWLLNGGGSFKGRLEGAFTDEIFYEFRNGPESLADDYYSVNLRFFWTSADDKFSVEFYGTNLTDEAREGNILVGFGLGVSAGDTGQEYITYNPPRQYGVTFGYKF